MKKLCFITLLLFIALPARSCEQEAYRQFDFWLGQWQVSNSSNDQISESKITLINNGCAVLEEYKTPSGYQGKSLNIFDSQTNRWHQTWVDNTGLLLQLNGHFQEGVMTLQGTTLDKQGKQILNKISWKKLADGRVNQIWQTSKDNGKHWQVAFDGYYRMVSQAK